MTICGLDAEWGALAFEDSVIGIFTIYGHIFNENHIFLRLCELNHWQFCSAAQCYVDIMIVVYRFQNKIKIREKKNVNQNQYIIYQ